MCVSACIIYKFPPPPPFNSNPGFATDPNLKLNLF